MLIQCLNENLTVAVTVSDHNHLGHEHLNTKIPNNHRVSENDTSGNEEPIRKKPHREKCCLALKALMPFTCTKPEKGTLPNQDVGLFSYVSLQWMDKWMWKASRHGVEINDIDKLHERDAAFKNSQRMKNLWMKELQPKNEEASFFRTLWKFNWQSLVLAALMQLINDALAFVISTWILKRILDFINAPQQQTWYGITIVIALSVVHCLKSIANNAMWVTAVTAGVRTQGAIQILIYNKVLTIETCSEKLLSEVINHITTDIEKIYQCIQLAAHFVAAPVMVIMIVTYCYSRWGPWSLLGNFAFILYFPVMTFVGKKISQLKNATAKVSDRRIHFVNQVLANIKLIKMYAWEQPFSEKIKQIRKDEEKILKTTCLLQSISLAAPYILSIISPLIMIIGLTLTGHNVMVSDVFTILSAFASLQLITNMIPQCVKALSEGLVGCRRIQKTLSAKDACILKDEINLDPHQAISLVNVDAGWPSLPNLNHKGKKMNNHPFKKKTKPPQRNAELIPNSINRSPNDTGKSSNKQNPEEVLITLNKINLIVEKGQLLGICGNVGSGKSSLLSAIIGNATVLNGSVNTHGKMAYVPQTAWIFNATVRQNIIFGLPYDEDRYKWTLSACCLEMDLGTMPYGDCTQLVDKGANLSGGQKQRINLARALYSNRDIYLLDDVLSAVDHKVAKHIFEQGIKNIFKKDTKTVLLVTHAMQFLEQCDFIALMKDGTICEYGTHHELIQQDGNYRQMIKIHGENGSVSKGTSTPDDDEKCTEESIHFEIQKYDEIPMVETNLSKEENAKSNSLTWNTWLYFCKQSGGYIITSLVVLVIFVFDLLIVLNYVWVQIWMDAGCKPQNTSHTNICNIAKDPQLDQYVAVYGASGVALILFGFIKAFYVGRVMLRGASKLHHQMFWKILQSPMNFIDTTQIGIIIDRFSRDMYELDIPIPFLGENVSQKFMLIAIQIVVILVYLHSYMLYAVVVFALYISLDAVFAAGVQATKKVDNLLRTPLLAHLYATFGGIAVIRCYNNQKLMAKKFQELVDQHLAAFFLFQLSSKWIAFRTSILTWLVLTATCLMIILSKHQLSVTYVGVIMLQIIRVTFSWSALSKQKYDLMGMMISLERIVHYCKNLKEEAASIISDNRPCQEWPQSGTIVASNIKLRYDPNLPLVLRGISMTIKSGEKVGIFGRTGAGKSSLIGALQRIRELNDGQILIDGIDISKIGLQDLRSKIAIIPQEPTLFEGTVRWNIDPFGVRTEEEIWEVLEKTYLKEKISNEPAKLDTPLSGDSKLFSLGEMQLLCLARALIRKNKILLLDEATASVDAETDRLIQQTIRELFAHCTVLTISHRLNTIMDYDKVIGMDSGEVVECDSPQNLLERDSLFHSMTKFVTSGDAQ